MRVTRPELYDARLCRAATVAVEPKLDGWWCRLTNEGGRVRAYGRNKELVVDVGLLFPVDLLPVGTTLDGELYIPGRPASKVGWAMKRCPSLLRFRAFSAPGIGGKSLVNCSYEEGRRAFELVVPEAYRVGFVLRAGLGGMRSAVKYVKSDWAGYEGVVVKERWYSGWWKVKPVQTLDGVVMGINKGRSIAVGLYNKLGELVPVANVGGMDDVTWGLLGAGDIGRVVEVRYEGLAGGGGLRFPRFYSWRDDKSACECRA